MNKYIIIYYLLEGEDKGVHSTVLSTSLQLGSVPSLRRAEKQLKTKLKQGNLKIITYKQVEGDK